MVLTFSSVENPAQIVKRIIILGDGAVGKTTLLRTLTGKSKETTITSFMEIDLFHVDDQKFVCFDLAGQGLELPTHPLNLMGDQILNKATVILLAFAIDRAKSLTNLQNWFISIKNYYNSLNMPIPPIFIIGTKADLSAKVDLEAVKFSSQNTPEVVDFILVSSATDTGINQLKQKICEI